MSYNVYRVAYAGLPRDHHAIFVEINDDQSGHAFQVVGDIQNGMTHGHKPAKKPEESATYQGKVLIGKVRRKLSSGKTNLRLYLLPYPRVMACRLVTHAVCCKAEY
ncbi:hypothetical protein BDW67DRAFT_170432 [Aspergillus spinulosporus]